MAKFTLHEKGAAEFHKNSIASFVCMVYKCHADDRERTCLFYLDITADKAEEAYKYRQDWVGLANIGTEVVFCDGLEEYTMGFVEEDPNEVKQTMIGWEGLDNCISTDIIVQTILNWFAQL